MPAHIDWQTLIAMGLVGAAAVHLLRRWWPRRRNHDHQACGTAQSSNTCGSGCGQCGNSTPTAPKVHTVQIVRQPRS